MVAMNGRRETTLTTELRLAKLGGAEELREGGARGAEEFLG